MNLENKLEELFIIGFRGTEIEHGCPLEKNLSTAPPGGVILFDRCLSDPTQPGNIKSPQQLQALVKKIQSLGTPPLFICIDQEGGMVQRIKPTNGFASTASAEEIGIKDSLDFTSSQAEKTASNLAEMHINVNFAPVADLNINRDNPIIGKVKRAFSANPDIVIRHCRTWIHTHRKHNIISCLKHFPGHGSSTKDSHLGFVDISTSWHKNELTPYRKLIAQKTVDMIMVGHLYNSNLDDKFPATLSHKTVTGLLREKMGYGGVVVTDDIQMKAITTHYGFNEAICQSLAAGIDMIVIGNNLEYNPNILQNAVSAVKKGLQQGILSESIISSALGRIQLLKQSLQDKKDGPQEPNP